jgi:hypothetical protein
MLPKDRVAAAFALQPSDRVPVYQAGLSSYAGSIVLGREAYVGGGIQQYREARSLWEGEDAHQEYLERSRRDAFDIAEMLDLDLIRPSYWRMSERPTRKIDEYTHFFGNENAEWRVMRFDPHTELYQVVDRTPHPEPTLDDLDNQVQAMEAQTVDYRPKADDFPDLLAALERFGGTRAIPGYGAGLCIPREIAWLEAIALRPDVVGRYLDCTLRYVEPGVQVMSEMGLPYLCGGGDFAGPLGPMYSPKAFHELMLPRLQNISDICHKHGARHGFASDGNLWSLADDLFEESGVDFFYEIDRRAGMDLAKLRQRFPRLVLWGGIASETLHRGTEEDVRVEVMTALDAARTGLGMIIGCSNQIVVGTPPGNIEVLIKTVADYR